VTKSLDIINGADRVSISGIDMNRPETSEIRHDGYQFRNELATSAPERDTFVLGGDEKRIHWFQERNGVNQGLVTGSRVNAQGNWEQTLDETKDYAVDSSLRPAVGSPAWGNELRAGLADTIAESTLPQELKDLFATFVGHDHEQAARMEEARGSWSTGRIGGLTDGFDSLDEVIAAIGSLGRELLAHAHLSSGLRPRGLVA
jgi:hypothetical protein